MDTRTKQLRNVVPIRSSKKVEVILWAETTPAVKHPFRRKTRIPKASVSFSLKLSVLGDEKIEPLQIVYGTNGPEKAIKLWFKNMKLGNYVTVYNAVTRLQTALSRYLDGG